VSFIIIDSKPVAHWMDNIIVCKFENEKGAPAVQPVRPLMPDALPALHLADTINPLGIIEARLTLLPPTGSSLAPLLTAFFWRFALVFHISAQLWPCKLCVDCLMWR
jgi:hypothetical protein